ncbi:MAG: HAD family hydrolase [Ruminococcus sp.]|nr:HAD family hydrolase [Ruminococcus sp.]
MGIASSTRREAVLKTLELFDLTAYFDQIVGGDQARRSKPAPEIYQKACAALCVPPESAYAVEDSYHGVQSAHDAGLHVIMIPDLLPPMPEMDHLTTRIFPDLHAF